MKWFKILVSSLVLVLFSGELVAQGRFDIKLDLKEEVSQVAVGFATVSVGFKGEKSAIKYALSTSKGQAKLENVPKGNYILKVEMIGYKSFTKDIKLSSDLDLGIINLVPDIEQLNAAKILGIGNAIEYKKDTISYNASSFMTSDNDMLEDLLEKLPGIEIGEDGTVTANGETIKKIMIDGKTFFLDDPQLATKNLPAKIIEKVNVVERKSEQAQFTGINDGEEETIIDLSIRPGMMNGWFGNVMAGGGHDFPVDGTYDSFKDAMDEDWRCQGAAMTGYFTGKTQISVVLNGNNTNDRGFNDLSGSMMSSMQGGGRGMMGYYGGDQGGSNGITTSWMTGLNGNLSLVDGDMNLGGNYVYSGTNNEVEELSSKVTFREDGSKLLYDNNGFNIKNTDGHRFGIRFDHKFKDGSYFLFQPQFDFGTGDYVGYNDFITEQDQISGNIDKINEGFSSSAGLNDNASARGFFLYGQKLGRPGRTLSLTVNYNFSQNSLDGFTQSLTENYNPNAELLDPDIINQRIDRNTNNSYILGKITYTEPLYKENLFLEAGYSYSWGLSESIKDAYNSSSNNTFIDEMGNKQLEYTALNETKDEIYSNSILNKSINHKGSLSFKYQKNKLTTFLGAEVNPTNTFNETNGKTYSSEVLNWTPKAGVFYDFNDNMNIRGYYYGRSQQPSTSQLMPVADNSNPLNVSFGNPYLKPNFSHNIRGQYGFTNRKTFSSLYLNFNGGFTQSPTINASWYDNNGVQYSMPVNGDIKGNMGANIMLSTPIAKSAFSISSSTSINYSTGNSYLGTSNLEVDKYYDSETAKFDYELFNTDFLENDELELFSVNKTQSLSVSENLRFTYKAKMMNLTLGGKTRYAQTWYSMNELQKNATWNNRAFVDMNWTIPGGVNLITKFNYQWYDGYTTQIDDEFIFNAEITKLLFKNNVTLALRAYDIFNQAKNVSIVNNENYYQENINNTLGRYVILSLTLRFGKFNGEKGNMGGRPAGRGGRPHRLH